MIKVEVPINYRPNITVFYRKARKRWFLEYTLPSDEELRSSLTLPQGTSERKAKQIANLKASDLEKGNLTESEFLRLSHRTSSDLTIDAAIQKYLNITSIEKSPRVVREEKNKLPNYFSYFKKELSLKFIHEVKDSHILNYRSYLLEQVRLRREFKTQVTAKLPFAEVEEKKKLTSKLRKTGLSPATAKSALSCIKKVFKALSDNKLILANPSSDVPSIKISEEDATRSNTITQNQIVKLMQSEFKGESKTDFPIKEFFLFVRETGCRKGEALHLEWDDIENGVWRIKSKPNCPTQLGLGWSPKWGKSRNVVLSPTALQVLDRIPKLPSVGYIGRKKKVGPRMPAKPFPAKFVFTVKDHNPLNKGGRRRVDCIDKTWKAFLKAAGIDYFGLEKPVTHDLRRTRNMEDQHLYGLDAEARGKKLGNSPRVNQRHYKGQVDEEILRLQAEINKLQAKLEESSGSSLLQYLEAPTEGNVVLLEKKAAN